MVAVPERLCRQSGVLARASWLAASGRSGSRVRPQAPAWASRSSAPSASPSKQRMNDRAIAAATGAGRAFSL